MMSTTVGFSTVDGTEAALGRAGSYTVVIDRPEGKAGGLGLGFNGAELLALALGGCFCNDLRYVSNASGIAVGQDRRQGHARPGGGPALRHPSHYGGAVRDAGWI